MADRREGRPRSIREVVEGLSNRPDLRYGARRLDAADALREVLDELLGPAVAGRCRVGSIIGAEARLECRDNATGFRVRFYVPDILEAVAARLEAGDVRAIRVTVSAHGWPYDEAEPGT
ncbi:MAG: DUF721 domain-containing protein [Chloroflexota bacterium]|nr:DUF721 domain-containing protein [Chloroflexota bacterium]MDE2920585.1 DUF721 domain-containing protein [Chloroflexota bacterium]